MDLVTIIFSIAVGATLASLSSVLLNLIKDFRSKKRNEGQVIIKRGSRTIKILTLTHDEMDRLLQDLKSYQPDNPLASTANN